jgi:APA family basic amino acid/polyamine antiporter
VNDSSRSNTLSREAREDSRQLGFWSTAALVVGYTIGVGIFLTPAELIGALASPALTFGLWLACGGLVLCGALTFGELASRHPQTGGLYVYLREAFGGRVAFLYGWLCLLIMDPGVLAGLAVGLSQYVVVLWPATTGREKAFVIGLIWVLALVNMAGLKPSSRVLNVLTFLKILAIAGIVGVAFTIGSGSWSHFRPFVGRRAGAPPIREALGLGLVSAFFSFGGFWEASRVAGETRDAPRTLPRALGLGVAAVTLIYVTTTLSFLYLVPIEGVTSSAQFARRAGEAMLGRVGPSAFAGIVALSVVASAGALLLMAPRVYLAMSRDGLFPGALAKLHAVTRAPIRATALLASMATLLVLFGNFGQILAFFMCPTLVFVALAASAVFVVRRRRAGATAFRSPGYPVIPALFVLLVLAVVLFVGIARPVPALSGFALVLAGMPVYDVLAKRGAVGRRRGGPP